METTMTLISEIRVIEDERRCLNELSIDYTLYQIATRCTTYYAIEIRSETESEMQIISQKQSHAQRVFELLFNEAVTPCTLTEILHDILVLEEEAFHRQNLS